MKVAVVGGGITGLSAAYRLREAGCEVVLLEETPRAGGKIYTERQDGWLVEHGPNGFLDRREGIVRLARDLGLESRIVRASAAAKRRYLLWGGRLRAVPSSPAALLRTDILSPKGRARLLAEPLVPRGRFAEESIFDFTARRLGVEAAESLVDGAVTGIFAGDIRRLSMQGAFPKIAQLEVEHGSLFRGLFATMRATGGPGKLATFPTGLGELVAALEARLGDALQTGRRVTRLEHAGGRWRVEASGGDSIEADAVVLSAPARVTARLVGPLAPAAAPPLEAIPYAPVAVVALGFPLAALPHALDGFGFVVPSRERRAVMGVVYCSVVFPDRAPRGHVLLRCIVGGARHPDAVSLPDDALVETVRESLGTAIGRMPPPVFTRIVRWPWALPQYTMGHVGRVQSAVEALRPLAGLHLAGAGLFGVSVPDCIERASALPAEVLSRRGVAAAG